MTESLREVTLRLIHAHPELSPDMDRTIVQQAERELTHSGCYPPADLPELVDRLASSRLADIPPRPPAARVAADRVANPERPQVD
jgi:hypothetical protein